MYVILILGGIEMSKLKNINLNFFKNKDSEGIILPEKIEGELYLSDLNEDLSSQGLEEIDKDSQSKKYVR